MRELKSIARLFFLCLSAFIQGIDMILWQKAEVCFVEVEGVTYSDIDRASLEGQITLKMEDN